MLVLAIDTSTPEVTAGVVTLASPAELIAAIEAGEPARPATVLAARRVTDGLGHAERLMPLVGEVMAGAGVALRDLDAVVAGLGPGPFTGLRVGLATAAALGDGLNRPVHGVPSHDGVARSLLPGPAGHLPGDLLVVTDARRREVYVSAYRRDGRRVIGPLVLAPAAVPELLAEHDFTPALLAGPGVDLLDRSAGARVDSTPDTPVRGLVESAATPLLTGAVPGPLVPLYLRRPDATVPGARKSVLGR